MSEQKTSENKPVLKALQNLDTNNAPSTTSTWTSDEDDEQIQSLKKKNSTNNKMNKGKAKVATVSAYPNLPPPQLANTFAEYTQKQRVSLTKNNLEKHTQIEHRKHKKQIINPGNGHTHMNNGGNGLSHMPVNLMQQSPYQWNEWSNDE